MSEGFCAPGSDSPIVPFGMNRKYGDKSVIVNNSSSLYLATVSDKIGNYFGVIKDGECDR